MENILIAAELVRAHLNVKASSLLLKNVGVMFTPPAASSPDQHVLH